MMKYLFEYETPRVVTLRHVHLGILRLLLQVSVLAFVLLYQLWYTKGYQSFDVVSSSVTTKVSTGFRTKQLSIIIIINLSEDRI